MSSAKPSTGEEPLFEHVKRTMMNSLTSCFGCVKSSDEKAKIKYKEYQIVGREKAFGVAYMDLVDGDATESELKACLETCIADLAVIRKEIKDLQDSIKKVEEETQQKIVAKPGETPAADPASSETPATKPAETPAADSAAKPEAV